MTIDSRTPCIIGAAQRTIRPGEGPSPEPLVLWDDVTRRARLGIDPTAYVTQIGELLAPFSEVASTNPYAWFPTALSAAHLSTPTPSNRIVGYPYTKQAVSVLDVLRADPGSVGMVTGVGMHMTKHVFGLYSTAPPPRGRVRPPDAVAVQAKVDSAPPTAIVDQHTGPVTLESQDGGVNSSEPDAAGWVGAGGRH